MRHVVIGTAGHIDHGKTALVRALTGTDTDRLAEEKRRGITIDLGFAHLTLPDGTSAGIVDVPGHEDFIRNMVAGAAGIDVALLVVAADEGVMPQTREHLAILRMLGVERMVVALTKRDLVDDEWLALATDDLRAHLVDTPWASAPVVHVSARAGTGLDALLVGLAAAATSLPHRASFPLFRMPVDRAFTVHGTGTVVTGTVRDGGVAVGDELRVLPARRNARVRGIERHGHAEQRAGPGERTALALAGLDLDAVGRGSWVASAGWPLTSALTVRLRLIDDSAWEIRQRQRLRVHIGTAEVMARVRLLGGTRHLGPGEEALAHLRLEQPVVARHGDRFVVRSYSPLATIGGGLVLEVAQPRRRHLGDADRRLFTALELEPAAALPLMVERAGREGVPVAELPLRLGSALVDDTAAVPGVARVGDRLVDVALLDSCAAELAQAVRTWHDTHPLRGGMEHAEARRRIEPRAGAFADAVIERAARSGLIAQRDGLIRLPDFEPRASADQAEALARIERVFRDAGLAAPRPDELPGDLAARPDFRDLLGMLEAGGVLLPFPPDRLLHREALEGARAGLERLAGRSGLAPGDFREAFDLPRKQLIPLLELLDRLGWTRREGEGRSVPEKSSEVPSPMA